MGFGLIGRHLYRLAMESDDISIPVICDIGRPDIIHYLMETEGSRISTAPWMAIP